METKNIIIFVTIAVVIVGGAVLLAQGNQSAKEQSQNPLEQSSLSSDSSSSSSASSLSSAPNKIIKTTYIKNMKIEILKEGTGEATKAGDTVTVNYTGTLTDGTKFDSSLNPGRTPFQFTLGQNNVIQGWELGVAGMKVGEKRKLTIPPELGYGEQGAGGAIPPNATLVFEVDLLKIN
jgi:FKBP-type peptidyl-prolyl cis-trans isomerase